MSDNDEKPQSGAEDVENREEPETVDLAEAAAQEAAKQNRTPKPDPDEFTPEQMRKLETMFKEREQSASNRAVNQYKEKIEKSGEYLRQDEVESMLEERLTAERERLELQSQAKEKFGEHLGKLGIAAGSDKYKMIAKAYSEMEAEGAITPKALLSEKSVRALAFAAGAIDAEEAAGPQKGFDTTYRLELDPPQKGNETTEDRMWEAVNRALGR